MAILAIANGPFRLFHPPFSYDFTGKGVLNILV